MKTKLLIIVYQLLFYYGFPTFILNKNNLGYLYDVFGQPNTYYLLNLSIGIFYRILLIAIFICIYKIKYFDKYKSNPKSNIVFEKDKLFHYLTHLLPITIFFGIIGYEYYQYDIEKIPYWWVIMIQIYIALFISDTLFYIAHRIMHTKHFYKYHKEHHIYQNTNILVELYSSKIEYIISIFVLGISTIMLNMHIVTFIIYQLILMNLSTLHHSGYKFTFFPLQFVFPINEIIFNKSSDEEHDKHHRFFNTNYGYIYLFWDYLFGTISSS